MAFEKFYCCVNVDVDSLNLYLKSQISKHSRDLREAVTTVLLLPLAFTLGILYYTVCHIQFFWFFSIPAYACMSEVPLSLSIKTFKAIDERYINILLVPTKQKTN